MGKTVEESLPRNPEEGARMPEPGPQVNRVVVLETGPKPLPERTRTFIPQPIDDDKMGTR
jgi:hypothetical protein